MTKRVWTTGCFAAIAAGFAGAAQAADLDRILYAPEIDRTVPVEIGNGWYLRGDIGYSVETEGRVKDFTYQGVTYDLRDLDIGRIDSELSAGIGAGYQFTDFLRFDVTADYTEGEGELDLPGVISDADFDAIGLLANAYVDLGTVVGFTPYVGAGIGATFVDWGPVRAGTAASSGGVDIDGAGDWRLTYALMAGVAYDLSKSLKLDLGYRYLDVAGGPVFIDPVLGRGEDDGYAKHEVRAGLRYSLW